MKRALVLSLIFALGIGIAASAGAFTGSWNTTLCLEWDADVLEFGDFTSSLYVDYSLSGWVLGSNLVFRDAGLTQMWFDAAGNFGAFSFTSIIEFNPEAALFVGWENIVEVSIAGVNFYALFGLQLIEVGQVGVGAAFGAVATAGDIDFGVEVQFGAGDGLYFVKLYGVQGAYGHYDGWSYCPAYGFWTLGGINFAESCDPGFTGLDLYVAFPFTCLDIAVFAGFSCEQGFEDVVILLENIDIGAGWFNIDSLAITFQTSGKSICMDLDLTLGDAICVTPYLHLISGAEGAEYEVQGISLDALTLTYNYNGVTFKAGEIFNPVWERESGWINAMTMCDSMGYTWYFSNTGSITRNSGCAFAIGEVYPNEFFGISIDGDSCCGGGFDVDLYNFLYAGGDAGEFGIFGWLGSYAAVSVDIGTAFTIGASTTVTYLGMESLCFNFGFSW
jgi:hypothetical protein